MQKIIKEVNVPAKTKQTESNQAEFSCEKKNPFQLHKRSIYFSAHDPYLMAIIEALQCRWTNKLKVLLLAQLFLHHDRQEQQLYCKWSPSPSICLLFHPPIYWRGLKLKWQKRLEFWLISDLKNHIENVFIIQIVTGIEP